MYIEDFFYSQIRIVGYIKLDKLKEFAKMNDEKISKKKQFKIFIKPAVVLFTINIVYWGIICPILNKINI
ncbi:MAG: hypothetical protein ACLT40_12435 [Fusobacterium sp.]